MKYLTEIFVPITLAKNVESIDFRSTIAAALDCFDCKRSARTVVLHENEQESFCTPTEHNFKGRIKSIEISDRKKIGIMSSKSIVNATYLIEHDFEGFSDKKYPHRKISPDATWGRASFKLRCSCGVESEHSTQNNISRPWKARCECGKDLFYEVEEIPIFRTRTKA